MELSKCGCGYIIHSLCEEKQKLMRLRCSCRLLYFSAQCDVAISDINLGLVHSRLLVHQKQNPQDSSKRRLQQVECIERNAIKCRSSSRKSAVMSQDAATIA